MNRYLIHENDMKLTGRGTYDEDGIYWCALSGSGFECHYKGHGLNIKLVGDKAAELPDNDANQVRYALYVDGERKIDGMLDSITKTLSLEGDIDADIKLIKLSECAMSTLGIYPIICDGVITPIPDKQLKIEFIGDSITCGYGVDVSDPNISFKTATEDFTKGFAYKTAKILDADIRAFSVSGWGIVSGYVDSPDKPALTDHLLPPYYKKLGFSYQKFDDRDGRAPQDIDWDFGKYTPDLIVINLGTNDNSWCTGHEDRYEQYVSEYAEFLGTVHSCNPAAKILCVMGIMLDEIAPYVEKAAQLFKEQSGFGEIYTMRFTPHDGSLGYAADWHPSPATHDKAAELLAAKIREIMG
ncbi:MAG: GDSL family lipase [Ruminiclostridium sp.]|nr:GDSL family lipase [Ruminiclostridium sp.]